MKNDSPTPDDFRFSCPIEVRFRDPASMRHVNNAVYLTYFENARTGYARALGHCDDDDDMAALFPFILLEVSCRYVAPAGLGDQLLVHLRTSRVGSKSFEYEYLITRPGDGATIAVGRSTQVYYDYASGRTLAVPEAYRRAVESVERSDRSA